jgi:hypothetical protein
MATFINVFKTNYNEIKDHINQLEIDFEDSFY